MAQCNKSRYSSEKIALLAISRVNKILKQKSDFPILVKRAYRCLVCGAWHLTSQEFTYEELIERVRMLTLGNSVLLTDVRILQLSNKIFFNESKKRLEEVKLLQGIILEYKKKNKSLKAFKLQYNTTKK